MLICIAFLYGCSTTSPKKILLGQSVAVAEDIQYSTEASITDNQTVMEFLLNGQISTDALKARDNVFDGELGDLKEAVTSTLVGTFKEGIMDDAGYVYSNDEQSATFTLTVVSLGLVQKNTFSSLYKPELMVQLLLHDNDGNELFSELETITAFNEQTPEYPLEGYLTDDTKLIEAFTIAADILIDDFLDSIEALNGRATMGAI